MSASHATDTSPALPTAGSLLANARELNEQAEGLLGSDPALARQHVDRAGAEIAEHVPAAQRRRERRPAVHLAAGDRAPGVVRVFDDRRGERGSCLLYTSPSPPDRTSSRMPSSSLQKKTPPPHSPPHISI